MSHPLLEYSEAKSVVICGDIHGDFHTLTYRLCVRYGMTDTLLIVAGDCGFGFERPRYYEQVHNEDAKRLRKANNWIAFVRGNHDNPAYFNEERIAYKRWRTVPDYSVISACGHNILCVGGAVSIDRRDRIEEQTRRALKETGYWWPDEPPVFSGELIRALPLPVDTVVTHTAPSFCGPSGHTNLRSWAEDDPTLLVDVAAERQTMDDILQELRTTGAPLESWFYGHFHQSRTDFVDGIRFRMLDILEFCEIQQKNLTRQEILSTMAGSAIGNQVD